MPELAALIVQRPVATACNLPAAVTVHTSGVVLVNVVVPPAALADSNWSTLFRPIGASDLKSMRSEDFKITTDLVIAAAAA